MQKAIRFPHTTISLLGQYFMRQPVPRLSEAFVNQCGMVRSLKALAGHSSTPAANAAMQKAVADYLKSDP